ncbi:MAG TPA: AmmeMemoRadiSam system protein A [Steroidobacteraceae bacterium]|nr:AmmeMemoRadiSam system protein A [Steroidobacteraceae bacterium]
MLEPSHSQYLLDTATTSITSHLAGMPSQAPAPDQLPAALRREAASFVTLTIEGRLRGCCGTLEARRALALDVWHNARTSAFSDPRFLPLTPQEWDRTDLEISILSELVPLHSGSEAALLGQLEPGRHGLVIEWQGARATFLPSVWEQLPAPMDFLRHLKLKAGWPPDFWVGEISAWSYETLVIERSGRSRRQEPGAS